MGQETLYDIGQSDALGTGEMRSLQALHEGLPAAFAAALSAMLRSQVDVRLAGIDQLSYGKFLRGLEDPAYFNVLKAEPLGDRAMLDIELAILYPLLDRLLGGRADDPPPRRPPSDIELPLAGRIVRLLLKELQQAWQGTLPLQFEVLQVASHPRLLRVLPADEMVAAVSFALTIGKRQGMVRLCWPCRALRQANDRLPGREGTRVETPGASTDCEGPDSPEAEVVVTLATTEIAAADVDRLRVGDVIVTETPADSPAVVSIDGEPRFRARPGTSHGRKAVVLSPIEPPPGS